MSQNQYHFIRWIHLHELFSGKRITTCIADFTFPLRPMKHLPEERNAILTLLTQSPSKVVVLIQMKLHFYVFNYWPVKNNCINSSPWKSCLDERFTRETAALGLDCCPWTHHGQEQQRGQRNACVCVCFCARMCVCVCVPYCSAGWRRTEIQTCMNLRGTSSVNNGSEHEPSWGRGGWKQCCTCFLHDCRPCPAL